MHAPRPAENALSLAHVALAAFTPSPNLFSLSRRSRSGPRNSSFQFKDNMVQLAQQAEAGNVSESFDNSCSVFAERFWDDQRRGSR